MIMIKLERIQRKIYTRETLLQQLAVWRFLDKKIVFTNGCFDLLHRGHIDYLSRAADLGDILVIGINSDDSVTRLKGPNRPLTSQDSRALLLASLLVVDAVILFDEDTPFDLIALVKPDILVKGGDYLPREVVGADLVSAKGGKVIILPYIQGYSTTAIEEKILLAGNIKT